MIALLLIYFIWKMYSHLAELYEKNKWVLAIIGIAMYYFAQFVAGLFIGVIQMNDPTFLSEVNDLVLNLIGIPIGMLATYGLYKFLKIHWAKKALLVDEDVLDAELLDNK